eukprot:scaffold228049_cov17-Tisochrysis_lutea.AAC.1
MALSVLIHSTNGLQFLPQSFPLIKPSCKFSLHQNHCAPCRHRTPGSSRPPAPHTPAACQQPAAGSGHPEGSRRGKNCRQSSCCGTDGVGCG